MRYRKNKIISSLLKNRTITTKKDYLRLNSNLF
jgi:hypothetical protein